jgi:hypothetical protein
MGQWNGGMIGVIGGNDGSPDPFDFRTAFDGWLRFLSEFKSESSLKKEGRKEGNREEGQDRKHLYGDKKLCVY